MRRRRAAEELLDIRLRSSEPFVDLEVRNPLHRTSYRVLFPEYPLRDSAFCSCTDFARRGLGTCKHVEAGWSWLEGRAELPEAPPAPSRHRPAGDLWKEVDRRLESLGRAEPTRIREVEAPGELLFEEGRGPSSGGARETVGRARTGRSPSTTTSRGRP